MLGAVAGQLLGRLATAGLATAGAKKLRRAGRRLAGRIAIAAVVGLLGFLALAWFGAAIWYWLLPQLGPAAAAAITGGIFLLLIGIILLAGRLWYADARTTASRAEALEASALAAGAPAALPGIDDIGALLERHAGTAMLVAFAIGLLAGRRK